MPGSADETGAAGYRPLLFSIAYGMTGSVGDAEDIVQDAFLGLTRARQAGTEIADPKAYLATAVTRLGINYLGSARVRRETYVGDWLPEPVVVPAGRAGPGRARRAGRLAVHGVPRAARGPLAGGAGGVHAARGVRVRLPGRGQDHRQDRGELPADLRPRPAAHRRRSAGRATARRPRRGGPKARNSPAGSSRPPRAATWTRCSACSRPTWCCTADGGGKTQAIGKPLAGRQRVMRMLAHPAPPGPGPRRLPPAGLGQRPAGRGLARRRGTRGRRDRARRRRRRVQAIHAVVNPDSLVISDRCLMWRDCRRRNYRNTDTTDEGGSR